MQDPDWYDPQKIEEESRRVFEICHGCRRCFNLCNSFPKLFELVDKAPSGGLDTVPSSAFKEVVDNCTLCDLCYTTKCPYTPPHEWNIDFPQLMLRYRALENAGANAVPDQAHAVKVPGPVTNYAKEHVAPGVPRDLKLAPTEPLRSLWSNADLMGPLGSALAPLTNLVLKASPPGQPPRLLRRLLSWLTGVHPTAHLPLYVAPKKTFMSQAKTLPAPNVSAPAHGKRKAVLFATCLVNWNRPEIGLDAAAVLTHNGVEVKACFPQCCGMPQYEAGKVLDVAKRAAKILPELDRWVSQGYDVVSVVPSCTFMLKQQYPLLLPDDAAAKRVSSKTYDISEYVVSLNQKEGLVRDFKPLKERITLQHACHARSQNMGFKSKEMLNLVPGMQITGIERCSGHGGTFGVMQDTHQTAMQVAKPVVAAIQKDMKKSAAQSTGHVVSSDCPLAESHLLEATTAQQKPDLPVPTAAHPIQLLAQAYGLNHAKPLE
jgi:glycerol-3-phosphate dehydrogenase subunit C